MSAISSSCSSFESYSNLENFLHSVTPIINHVSVHLNGAMRVQANDESKNAHLKLQDIWEIYDEWSSCGVGIPISLNNDENIVQYYVPYLSAIQVFIKTSPLTSSEKEIDLVALSSSDYDDASTKSNNNNLVKEVTCNGFKACNHDHLYVQFYETCSPYSRVPFLDKIMELAQSYPGLLTFYINDISPASWMSIAWYPIYHIPARVYSSKDLSTCFLTFHTLSCCFQDTNEEGVEKDANGKVSKKFDLVPFGLATYKMQGDVWNNRDKGDDEKIKDLESAASSWLRQLHIQHYDFIFFTQ